MINGVINVYKEPGYTSHDVVAKLRGILKQKKIGHMGTLDPNAVGVLPVCLGKATKLCNLLSEKETFFRKTYNQMMVTAKIQSEAVLALDGKCIYGYCTSEMMEEYGVTTKDLDAVVASIRNVDGVEVAMFLYQLSEDSYKVSLRSKNYVDVSKIAVENGGGGHVRAAGAEIHGELNDIINKLLNRIKQDI